MRLACPVTRTDLALAALTGVVEDHGDHLVVRRPDNPGHFHGNALVLGAPPDRRGLASWVARFRQVFPEAGHLCLRWDGPALSGAEPASFGLEPDDCIAMVTEGPPSPVARTDLEVRPLDPRREWSKVVALDQACSPAEESETFRRYKDRIRAEWRAWVDRGAATWWGAFEGGRLVGQCGLASLGDLARFQAVETHPDARRRGVGAALIATVTGQALSDGARQVILAAEPDGPALGLYRRLGFREVGCQRTLVAPDEGTRIRPETPADAAGVRTLTTAAFGRPAEADLVDRLRGAPGVLSLVADRSGKLLGHALFTPVQVEGPEGSWGAIALGPMAVRPGHQRAGIGSALVRAGLAACREAGHGVCFVLGHPDFYGRLGFVPAAPLGLRCAWEVPEGVFRVAELAEGALAGRTGRVRYAAAFEEVP